MKRLRWLVALFIVTCAGCWPHWLVNGTAAPDGKECALPKLPPEPVMPGDVTPANAHAKAQALWDECDRESQVQLCPPGCPHCADKKK